MNLGEFPSHSHPGLSALLSYSRQLYRSQEFSDVKRLSWCLENIAEAVSRAKRYLG